MALRFNGLSPVGANPFSAMCTSAIGNTSAAVGTTANLTTQWGRSTRHAIKRQFGDLASEPPASESPVAWTLADEGGDLACENTVNQSNTVTLDSLALGVALAADLTQDASITAAALSMITSLSCNLQQEGQLTAPMQMTLNLAADLVQSGNVEASLSLIAWMQAELVQNADVSASNLRGTLSMEASIVSYSAFTAEGVRDAVWQAILANYPTAGTAGNTLSLAGAGGVDYTALSDAVWQRIVEAGFTAEQILRILAAHAAGAATDLEGTNPQFTGLDGTTLRIDGAYAAGTRTIDTLDGT